MRILIESNTGEVEVSCDSTVPHLDINYDIAELIRRALLGLGMSPYDVAQKILEIDKSLGAME